MTTVLFWDIDGTLLDSGGAGRLALTYAASEMVSSKVDLSAVKMAGRTDWAIANSILQHLEIISDSATIEELLTLYRQHLPASLSQTQGYVLAGVNEILEALKSRFDVRSFLLTGNIEDGARMKLSYYKLNNYFAGGGFCQTTSNRIDIAHQALTLAQKQIGTVDLDKCYVIGDTPHDIHCGQAIGAKTIAIASGRYSVNELISCNGWLVWEYFPTTVEFMENVGLKQTFNSTTKSQ